MKKNRGKIALPAARSAIERIKATGPPNVSIENARKILGPDLYRMIKQGWLDDDIIVELSDQNESDLRRLLIEARREERSKRKEREKVRAEKKADRASRDVQNPSGLIPHHSERQAPSMTPMLTAPPLRPSLALPAPSARVERQASSAPGQPDNIPPAAPPRPITRNRGIRRP